MYSKWEYIWGYLNSYYGVAISVFVGLLLIVKAIHQTNKNPDTQPAALMPDVHAAPAPLTEDQRQFRMALKAFAIYYPVRLNNCLHTVLAIVMQSEKDINRDTPNSVAFHFLLKIITNQQPDGLSYLTQLNETKIDDLDIGEIQRNVKAFLEAYRLRQMIIGTLNEAIKVLINSSTAVEEWMKIDDDARKDFDKLKIWPEAAETIKSENHDNKWASVGRAWQTQHRLGYE
jgi:hypothetical protein